MMSVNDMFYNEKDAPVMVVGHNGHDEYRGRGQVRRGHLSRQDSRNFRSSASPPPSRSSNHASSWFGHRKSSQSPTRSRRDQAYPSEYSDYRQSGRYGRSPERSSYFGRSGSRSPPSSYHEMQSHTKYKEDYTGYPLESGYTAEAGYAPGYDRREYGHEYGQGYGREGRSHEGRMYEGRLHEGRSHEGRSREGRLHEGRSSYSPSSGIYPSTVPRTYQGGYVVPIPVERVYQDYPETVVLKVPLCCEACEERITNHMLALEGVESVTCDQEREKVTVRGTAAPSDILKQGKECFKQTTFWRH